MKKTIGKTPLPWTEGPIFRHIFVRLDFSFWEDLRGKIKPLKTNEYFSEHFLEKMVPFQGTFVHFQGMHSKFQSGRDLEKFAAAWRNKERSTIAGCLLCCVD